MFHIVALIGCFLCAYFSWISNPLSNNWMLFVGLAVMLLLVLNVISHAVIGKKIVKFVISDLSNDFNKQKLDIVRTAPTYSIRLGMAEEMIQNGEIKLDAVAFRDFIHKEFRDKFISQMNIYNSLMKSIVLLILLLEIMNYSVYTFVDIVVGIVFAFVLILVNGASRIRMNEKADAAVWLIDQLDPSVSI